MRAYIWFTNTRQRQLTGYGMDRWHLKAHFPMTHLLHKATPSNPSQKSSTNWGSIFKHKPLGAILIQPPHHCRPISYYSLSISGNLGFSCQAIVKAILIFLVLCYSNTSFLGTEICVCCLLALQLILTNTTNSIDSQFCKSGPKKASWDWKSRYRLGVFILVAPEGTPASSSSWRTPTFLTSWPHSHVCFQVPGGNHVSELQALSFSCLFHLCVSSESPTLSFLLKEPVGLDRTTWPI